MSLLFIVGAPRSGTNALRNSIVKLSNFETWPCDEINYIWRYGNSDYPTDVLLPEMLNRNISRYIHKQFSSQYIKVFGRESVYDPSQYLVEKTCANCLRLPYVDALFPDANYLYIRRNPYDVVASSIKRWSSSPEFFYLYQKAKYVPLSEISYYASDFIGNRLKQLFSPDHSLPSWGPRFEMIDQYRKNLSLIELIAKQWHECTTKAEEFFSLNPQLNVATIDYENFTSNPCKVLASSFESLGLRVPVESLPQATADIHSRSVNKSSTCLNETQLALIDAVFNA